MLRAVNAAQLRPYRSRWSTIDIPYTDISCWNIVQNAPAFKEFLRNPAFNDVKRKILFGTDWYLTLATMSGKEYREFCEEIKDFLDDIDRKLWVRFSLVNPFEFYDLGNEVRLENVMEGIRGLGLDDSQHKRAKTQYDRIRSVHSEWNHAKTMCK